MIDIHQLTSDSVTQYGKDEVLRAIEKAIEEKGNLTAYEKAMIRVKAKRAAGILSVEETVMKVDLCALDCKIPERFRPCTIDNYEILHEEAKQALSMINSYITDADNVVKQGKSLLLIGECGTGKTHIGCAILRAFYKLGYQGQYMNLYDLFQQVKSAWKNYDHQDIQLIKKLAQQDILVIDEVGVQYNTQAEKMIIYDLFNKRYQQKKPSIIISNLPVYSANNKDACLACILGERVIDRLRDGGKQIVFNWGSFRR